jgi:hypothetical protein
MREDAQNLLDRLGASGLTYREFPDRYADFAYWPLFAAIAADPEVRARIDAAEALPPEGIGDARAMQQYLATLSESGSL